LYKGLLGDNAENLVVENNKKKLSRKLCINTTYLRSVTLTVEDDDSFPSDERIPPAIYNIVPWTVQPIFLTGDGSRVAMILVPVRKRKKN